MLISIVIPTTGVVLELQRSLSSICQQTLEVSLEVVIVENNSLRGRWKGILIR